MFLFEVALGKIKMILKVCVVWCAFGKAQDILWMNYAGFLYRL